MTDVSTELPGLDGATPLGFLASLGVLKVLAERSPDVRLAWRERGSWRPLLNVPSATIVDSVQSDVAVWSSSPVLAFRYIRVTKKGPELFGGLTPPLQVLRGWLKRLASAGDLTALEYACGLIAESATYELKNTDAVRSETLERFGIEADTTVRPDQACMQTPFDFSSRNIQFLDNVDNIRRALADNPSWITPALFEGTPVMENLSAMDWDVNAKAPGAQYATRKMARHPVLEWLAFRALALLPAFGSNGTLRATACRGKRLAGAFIWPLWTPPASVTTVRSLLSYPKLEQLEVPALRALGVAQRFKAGLGKLGKYDAIFTPSQPIGGVIEARLIGEPPLWKNDSRR